MRSAPLSLLLAGLAACGDGLVAPDAAVLGDASTQLVSLQLLTSGTWAAEQRVFFQNRDSSLALATRTDRQGRANAFMAPGGFITVAARLPGIMVMYTIAEVEAGEAYTLDLRQSGAAQQRQIFVSIPRDAGSTAHRLYSSCGAVDLTGPELEPVPAMLYGCDDHADLLVYAPDTDRYLYRDDAPIPENAQVAFEGAYVPNIKTHVAVSGVPPEVHAVLATQRLIGQGRVIFPLDEFASRASMQVTEGAGAEFVGLTMPAPTDGTLMTWLDPQATSQLATQHVVAWSAPQSSTVVDFAPLLQRPIQSQPRYASNANRIDWIEGVRGARPDAAIATMSWRGAGTFVRWHVLAPRHDEPWIPVPTIPEPSLQPQAPELEALTMLTLEGGVTRLNRLGLIGTWRPHRGVAWPVDAPSGHLVYQQLVNHAFPGGPP